MHRTNGKNNGSFHRSTAAKKRAQEFIRKKIKDQESRGPGRPSPYRGEETDELTYKLALLGAKDPEIADALKISVETLDRWKLTRPSFCQSLIDGRDTADANVAKSLYQRALGYSHPDVHITVMKDRDSGEIQKVMTNITKHYPPDTTACAFWLKNRQRDRWRDVSQKEVTGKDGLPIQHNMNILTLDLSKLSDDELKMCENIGLALKQNAVDIEAKQLTDGDDDDD